MAQTPRLGACGEGVRAVKRCLNYYRRVGGILEKERKGLVELNIPVFFMHVESNKIYNHKGFIFNFDCIPGLAQAKTRLSSLSNREIEWQSEIIKVSTVR